VLRFFRRKFGIEVSESIALDFILGLRSGVPGLT